MDFSRHPNLARHHICHLTNPLSRVKLRLYIVDCPRFLYPPAHFPALGIFLFHKRFYLISIQYLFQWIFVPTCESNAYDPIAFVSNNFNDEADIKIMMDF